MDELLQYYERELGTLHAHNQAFARRYPAIAGALGIVGSDLGTTDDPHLARMLQAFAMFNARTAKRLADGFGTFSETLLEVNFPHYLRPFPACAIARIDNDLAAVSELAVIPRGTLMHAAEHQSVACKFTTAYDVAVAPLRLSEVRFQSIVAAPPAVRLPPDLGAAISITLEATGATSTLDGLALPTLRLFLDGEPSFCATLRDSLFLRARCTCVEVDGVWHALDAVPLHPVGFAGEDALMPAMAASHPAYRLLGEWFAFPDKFNFVDLDLAALRPLLPPACRRCTVHLLLADASGSVRTARSLLISAWKQLGASGKQLDGSEHAAVMQECLELFSSLGDFAAQHQALALDAAGSKALGAAIAADQAAVSITAPEGVALSTPQTISGNAGANIDLVAQQHLQLSAAQRCNVNAGKGISLFAHQDGIVQVAHFGKFLLQSQHDLLQADAAKEIRLTAGTRLVGVAQDEITFMTAGGAYLKLSGGEVELGGPGALTVKTDGHHWNGPASMKGERPTFGEGELGRVPRLLRPTDGLPVDGVEVHIEREGDSPLTGVSGADGRGPKVETDHLQRLKGFFFRRRS
ncbi:MAG: type VI secretion system baseplate subunit TssF [Burkholderiales bacterium]|nr:type VI secretion system baseplate subunit TssF [Burkholderiales bacterium]MBH1996016.1 type VI secretion system baseplate subunit TssF [Burkholderiales bacterium]MBH2071978.1 type VI secretion system baseplate subunit TssF [Burkholderiales bacterium]